MPDPNADPVLLRRAKIKRLVDVGQRLGYGLFLLAIVAFVAGVMTDFAGPTVAIVVASLVVGSLVLAPAIVFGYAVRAAEREEREEREERRRAG